MNPRYDLSGKQFGRLTVVAVAARQGNTLTWNCRCSCGGMTVVRSAHLKSGSIQSCGCLRKEVSSTYEDLTGMIFDRWTVVSHQGKRMSDHTWLCRCSCGNERIVRTANLKNGSSRSCGCLQSEVVAMRNSTHGLTGTKVYRVWSNMIRRCEYPKAIGFSRYGAKGVTVCEAWHSFENFFNDMGNIPKGMTLDRIDNTKGYCKSNCRWATPTTQARNRGEFSTQSTPIKGVVIVGGRYRAKIGVNYKQIHLGYFTSLEGAAIARQKAESHYWSDVTPKGISSI